MLHSIFTILTTSAVTLHALLGCCAHHTHSCAQQSVAVTTSACAHAHEHPQQANLHESTDDQPGQQHPGERQHDDGLCDTPDCSFVSSLHGQEVGLTLLQTMSLPMLGDAHVAITLNGSLMQQTGTVIPPDSRPLPERLRALSQVWVL